MQQRGRLRGRRGDQNDVRQVQSTGAVRNGPRGALSAQRRHLHTRVHHEIVREVLRQRIHAPRADMLPVTQRVHHPVLTPRFGQTLRARIVEAE